MAGLNEDHVFFKFIGEQKSKILIYTLVAFGVSLVLGIILNLMISHKIAGPIVRLRNFFSKPDNYKEIQYLNFRQGDFFIELPELIRNFFVTNLARSQASAPETEEEAS